MNRNLTQGNPLTQIFFYALPLLGGNFFQQMYSMTDAIIVGQYQGTQALAAVGSSFPISFLALAVAQGLSSGTNVAVSQLFGAGRIFLLKTTITTAVLGMGFLGLLFSLFGPFLAGPMLTLLGTDAIIFDQAESYLQIYFLGTFFLFLFNTLNGIFTAMGDSKTPLLLLCCSTLLNIGLDFYFLIALNMGVEGVAWATMLSQGVCGLGSFYFLKKRFAQMSHQDTSQESAPPTEKPPLFRWSAVTHIARIGIPSTLQQSVVSLSAMSMQGLVNSYGYVFVGGYTAATKVEAFAILPSISFNNAMATYTAQNLGAGKPERVPQGLRACLLVTALFSLGLTLLIYLFTPTLLSLFLEDSANNPSTQHGLDYLRTVSLFYPMMGCFFVSGGLLRGGSAIKSFVLCSATNLISRVIFAYTFRPLLGMASIWWSMPAGWVLGWSVAFYCYKKGYWNKKVHFA